ncbi:MAG: hypothetical protein D6756_13745 [Cyanobacteria bacterium J083]|nr:MAG: hypothetical protein D6756_13745 [Cyanobacteria bacterium J083]
MNFSNSTKLLSRSLIGAIGLSAIALLASPGTASAALECGVSEGSAFTGATWVSNCPEGMDLFPNSWAKIELEFLPGNVFEVAPGNSIIELGGPAKITREEGNNGVINTIIEETLTGVFNNISVTLTGNGTGAIVDDGGADDFDNIANNGFAGSFFEVGTQIDIGGTILSTLEPVRVEGDRPLVGVSPDRILPPGFPGSPDSALNCPRPDLAVPPISIAYCGNIPADLFVNDDPTMPAGVRILAEVHTVHPHVPEPAATLGTLLFGLGSIFSLKRKVSS